MENPRQPRRGRQQCLASRQERIHAFDTSFQPNIRSREHSKADTEIRRSQFWEPHLRPTPRPSRYRGHAETKAQISRPGPCTANLGTLTACQRAKPGIDSRKGNVQRSGRPVLYPAIGCSLAIAGIVYRLLCELPKLERRVRLPLPAPDFASRHSIQKPCYQSGANGPLKANDNLSLEGLLGHEFHLAEFLLRDRTRSRLAARERRIAPPLSSS